MEKIATRNKSTTQKSQSKSKSTPQNSPSIDKNSQQVTENFDFAYGITKTLRQEVITCKPPKNSLSELVYGGKIDELKKRLKNETIDPNLRDECGSTCSWTPLYWSVKLGNLDIARILLNHGANINLVVNDFEECCGTVLDLATLRGDEQMESLLREFAEKDDINFGQSYKAIRTKLRGRAPAFNFRYYGKKKEG